MDCSFFECQYHRLRILEYEFDLKNYFSCGHLKETVGEPLAKLQFQHRICNPLGKSFVMIKKYNFIAILHNSC